MAVRLKVYEKGYMLTELLICAVLFFLLMTAAVPVTLHRRHEQYAVDETARELVSDLQILRTHSIGNQAAAKEVKKIYVRSGEYVLTNSVFSIEKRKVFPETVRSRSNGNGIVSFDAAGRPEGKTMHIVIESQDKAYKRDIIIAAQTGRIRME